MTTLIRAEHISHSFGKKKVIDDISFQVQKGEVIGLLGPSGAGKTTLIKILTGQLVASEGSVERCGGEGELETGIMMDTFGLYERLSVRENLRIFADIYRVPTARIEQLLGRTGLQEARNTAVSKLSKGMRGRVNLCRALLKEADILYLDEPTSGLDPATTRMIHELIGEEQKAGTTVFLTTHNMHEAERLCGRVLLLCQGKIVEQGCPEDICSRHNTQNEIAVTLRSGERHILRNGGESEGLLSEWLRTERILTIHSSEPDLEKVFLGITGRRLSD